MKVTTKDVEYIAQLSRFTIPEGEMEKFTEQFNQILNYADILQKLDTAGRATSSRNALLIGSTYGVGSMPAVSSQVKIFK